MAGILDAADEQMLLLETIRGCIFKCKFCYYPKSYDDLYFVSEEKIVANLEHAQRRGAEEVVLLDPTPMVTEVLVVAGLDQLLPIVRSEDEARAAFGGA